MEKGSVDVPTSEAVPNEAINQSSCDRTLNALTRNSVTRWCFIAKIFTL